MRTHIAGRGPRLLSISLEVRTIDPLGLCMPALMTTRSLARFRVVARAARVGSTPPAGRAIDPIRFQTDTTTAPLHCCAIGITVLLRACVGRLRRCTAEKNYWDRPAGRVGVCACGVSSAASWRDTTAQCGALLWLRRAPPPSPAPLPPETVVAYVDRVLGASIYTAC
jgi:hypothetical protein